MLQHSHKTVARYVMSCSLSLPRHKCHHSDHSEKRVHPCIAGHVVSIHLHVRDASIKCLPFVSVSLRLTMYCVAPSPSSGVRSGVLAL
jgi:hypothetical protein